MEDQPLALEESPKERKRLNRWLIVALAGAVAAGVLLASTVWEDRWSVNAVAANEAVAAQSADPQSWCAAQATYDAIRRELFRRAAQVRGSDEQAYARLADFALLRMSGPVARGVDEQLGSVTCSAAASLDLPPGVAAAGGRRSLSGDLDYTVQSAADGTGNVVRLGNADAIVIPLATLARAGAPQGAPLVAPGTDNAIVDEPAPINGEAPIADQPANAIPSFDCGDARSRGEIAVCGDPGLAALDRQMAAQFNAALSDADGRQRALLNRTRGRFLSFRDRCSTNACVAETYRSRMREISDIMADRWRG